MEWSRIKSVLIVALFIVDIMFIGMIVYPHLNQSGEDSRTFSAAMNLLENRGIDVEADMIFEEVEMPVLSITYAEGNGIKDLARDHGQNSSIASESEAQKAAEEYIQNNLSEYSDGIRLENISCTEGPQPEYTVSFGGYYKSYRLKDSYIIFTADETGLTKVNIHLIDSCSPGKNSAGITSVTTALLQYMNYIRPQMEEGERSVITDISLVYMVESPYGNLVMSDTAVPAWKIVPAEGDPYYISAIK